MGAAAGLEDPKPLKQLSVLPTPQVGFGAAQDRSQPRGSGDWAPEFTPQSPGNRGVGIPAAGTSTGLRRALNLAEITSVIKTAGTMGESQGQGRGNNPSGSQASAFLKGRELLGKQTLLQGGNNETIPLLLGSASQASESSVFREISLPWGTEKKGSNS